MKIHHLDVAAALATLSSSTEGLTQAEAARRLAEFGPNRSSVRRGSDGLVRLAAHFTHFFALILWLAAGLAFLAEHVRPPRAKEGRQALASKVLPGWEAEAGGRSGAQ